MSVRNIEGWIWVAGSCGVVLGLGLSVSNLARAAPPLVENGVRAVEVLIGGSGRGQAVQQVATPLLDAILMGAPPPNTSGVTLDVLKLAVGAGSHPLPASALDGVQFLQQADVSGLQGPLKTQLDAAIASMLDLGTTSNIASLETRIGELSAELNAARETVDLVISGLGANEAIDDQTYQSMSAAFYDLEMRIDVIKKLLIPALRFLGVPGVNTTKPIAAAVESLKTNLNAAVGVDVRRLMIKISTFNAATWQSQLWSFVHGRMGNTDGIELWCNCFGFPAPTGGPACP